MRQMAQVLKTEGKSTQEMKMMKMLKSLIKLKRSIMKTRKSKTKNPRRMGECRTEIQPLIIKE